MLYVIECKNGISINIHFDTVRIGNKPHIGSQKQDAVVGLK